MSHNTTRRGLLSLVASASLSGCIEDLQVGTRGKPVSLPRTAKAWPVSGATPGRTCRNPCRPINGTGRTTLSGTISTLQHIRVDGEYLVGLLDGYPAAYSRNTGNIVWRFDSEASQVAITERFVLCNQDGVTALDRDSGEVKWKLFDNSGGRASSYRFLVHKNAIIVGGSDGTITATGPRHWKTDTAEQEAVDVRLLSAGDAIILVRAVEVETTKQGTEVTETKSTVDIFDKAGKKVAHNTIAGIPIAVAATETRLYVSTLEKSATITNGSVKYQNKSSQVNAVDIATGKVDARYDSSGTPISKLGVYESDPLAIQNKTLVRLDGDSLDSIWASTELPDLYDKLAIGQQAFVVSGGEEQAAKIHQVSCADGSLTKSMDVGAHGVVDLIITSGGIYVRTTKPEKIVVFG